MKWEHLNAISGGSRVGVFEAIFWKMLNIWSLAPTGFEICMKKRSRISHKILYIYENKVKPLLTRTNILTEPRTIRKLIMAHLKRRSILYISLWQRLAHFKVKRSKLLILIFQNFNVNFDFLTLNCGRLCHWPIWYINLNSSWFKYHT